MARKLHLEAEGGLYRVITRGNNRQVIFNDPDDYLKFLSLLEIQNGPATKRRVLRPLKECRRDHCERSANPGWPASGCEREDVVGDYEYQQFGGEPTTCNARERTTIGR